jgi:hypothetical protein
MAPWPQEPFPHLTVTLYFLYCPKDKISLHGWMEVVVIFFGVWLDAFIGAARHKQFRDVWRETSTKLSRQREEETGRPRYEYATVWHG